GAAHAGLPGRGLRPDPPLRLVRQRRLAAGGGRPGSRGARGGDVRLARRVALSLAGSHRPGGPPAGDGRGRSRQRGTPFLEPPAAALDPPAALDLPGRGPALPDVAGDGVVLLRRLRPERRGRIGGGGSEIGRASCREREEVWVVGVSWRT